MRTSALLALCLAVSAPLTACDDDESPEDGGGGSGAEGAGAAGAGDQGGGGGAPPSEGQVVKVSAPTRETIQIDLEGDLTTVPTDAAAYAIGSDRGPLEVVGVAVEQSPPRVVLTTEKQKLGVTYELQIASPGSDFDQEGGSFLAADTAVFWATDFNGFQDIEVTARRVGVGEHVVLYATDEADATDIDETIQVFDEEIFPIETALLNAPPDRDDNGKILLLGLDGEGNYGGYFSPVNAMDAEQAEQFGYHSNEMEMLYVSVPDLEGRFDPLNVVPHEFSHLLYNEGHPFFVEDWAWHNEGLAECAVHAVHGKNDIAVWYYLNAPELATGKSLVKWEYSNYSQYVQAYMFWTYVASRLGGVPGYGELFDETGNPAAMDAFFQAELGKSFVDVQLDMMTAAWLQQPDGVWSFGGMLSFAGPPQSSGLGAAPELSAFEAVFLTGAQGDVTPSGFGPDVRHRAIDALGNVDDVAPLSASGGVVIALNALQNPEEDATQSAGTFAQAVPPPPALPALAGVRDPAWKHPPPVKPANRRLLERWQAATRKR